MLSQYLAIENLMEPESSPLEVQGKGLGTPPATCSINGITLWLDVAGRTDFIFGMGITYVSNAPKFFLATSGYQLCPESAFTVATSYRLRRFALIL
jgi:hypothetical protein